MFLNIPPIHPVLFIGYRLHLRLRDVDCVEFHAERIFIKGINPFNKELDLGIDFIKQHVKRDLNLIMGKITNILDQQVIVQP